jgi:hypothetical protein
MFYNPRQLYGGEPCEQVYIEDTLTDRRVIKPRIIMIITS